MSRKDKLLERIKNNPDGLSIDEFHTLMKQQGWILDHQSGSHEIWYSPKSRRLSVQNRNGKPRAIKLNNF